MSRYLIFLFVIGFAETIASAIDPVLEDVAKLQGKWQAVESETKGERRFKDDRTLKDLYFEIVGTELRVKHASRGGPGRTKTFKIDPSKSPKEIDLTSHDGVENGQTAAGIYKLEGDRLFICLPYWSGDPLRRPTMFKATDDVLMLYILERGGQQ